MNLEDIFELTNKLTDAIDLSRDEELQQFIICCVTDNILACKEN